MYDYSVFVPTRAEATRDLAEEQGIIDFGLDEADFPMTSEEEEMAPIDWIAVAREDSSQRARLAATLRTGSWVA